MTDAAESSMLTRNFLPRAFGVRNWAILAACLITLPLSIHIPLRPDHSDGSLFCYIGEMWTKGVLPYLQLFDNKPPGVFVLTAIASLTHHSLLALAIIHFIFTLGCIISLRRLLQRSGASTSSISIGTVVIALLVNFRIYWAGNMPESYLLWPMSASMLAFWNALELGKLRYVFLAGLCSGIACLFKPFGASAFLAQIVISVVFMAPRFHKGLFWSVVNAAGAIAAWIPVGIYFALHSGLAQMIDASIFYNIHYGVSSQPRAIDGFKLLLEQLLPVSSALLCLLLGIASVFRGSKSDNSREKLVWKLSLFWFAAGLLLVQAAGRGYDQYFLSLTPALGLIVALFFGRIEVDRFYIRRRGLIIALVVLPIAFFYLRLDKYVPYPPGQENPASSGVSRGETPADEGIVEEIKKKATSSSTLLVWGYEPWLFYATGLQPSSRYVSVHYVYDSPRSYSVVGGEILDNLRTSPPDLIVVAADWPWKSRHGFTEPDKFEGEFFSKLRQSYREIWRGDGYVLYGHRT